MTYFPPVPVQDIEDGTFERRHQKYEVAEQKRKRWDIQRVRELREHERLEQKMLRREYGNWDDILKTFYPEPSDGKDPAFSRRRSEHMYRNVELKKNQFFSEPPQLI